jgi:hypothetical protein
LNVRGRSQGTGIRIDIDIRQGGTMKKQTTAVTAGLLGVVLMSVAGACVQFAHQGPTSPSDLTKVLATGTWSSSAGVTGTLDPGTCGNFAWQITELTTNSASGTFSATCAGGLTLAGTAQGTLAGSTLNWTASGTVGGAGISCSFSLTGTAALEGDGVRVNYSGTTCLGPVSGSQLLKKR